jgi:hypothetical protein
MKSEILSSGKCGLICAAFHEIRELQTALCVDLLYRIFNKIRESTSEVRTGNLLVSLIKYGYYSLVFTELTANQYILCTNLVSISLYLLPPPQK